MFSHHLRDGSRRGLWLWSGVSIQLSYSHYIILTLVTPLILRIFYKNCDKQISSDTIVKYSPIISHV